ncbi:transposase [Spirosoma sp.]|uniref:transposase n=1 Tax=Spirosoma sp. TaxID=1899569 RepID=UPI003B3A0E43
MKNKAIRYDDEFKARALDKLRNGVSVYKLSQQLRISPLTLKRWQQAQAATFAVPIELNRTADKPEIEALHRQILRLEEEKRVLKVALNVLLKGQ